MQSKRWRFPAWFIGALRRDPRGLLLVSSLVAGVLVSTGATLFQLIAREVLFPDRRVLAPLPLEDQTVAALKKLQENSQELADLLKKLSDEIEQRAAGLRQLQTQRRLLELTQEQRLEFQRMLNPPRTLGQRLTSAEFWIYGVVPNLLVATLFFALGIAVERRWRNQRVT
jgi:hypothetical protein